MRVAYALIIALVVVMIISVAPLVAIVLWVELAPESWTPPNVLNYAGAYYGL